MPSLAIHPIATALHDTSLPLQCPSVQFTAFAMQILALARPVNAIAMIRFAAATQAAAPLSGA